MSKVYRSIQARVDINPTYKEQELEEFRGNPYIEALPLIFTEDDIFKNITVDPVLKKAERQADASMRYHMVKRLLNFTHPMDRYFDLVLQLSSMIRYGYAIRNPLSKEALQKLDFLCSLDKKHDISLLTSHANSLSVTSECHAIIGLSGIGKTTAIVSALKMYPQIISHKSYKGRPFSRNQLVWLKVDCPYDGKRKTLCQSFFKAMDQAMGTNYYSKYGNRRYDVTSMMADLTEIVARHGLGVLVIDEIQHLQSKNIDTELVFKFITSLSNTIGVPLIFIGTPKASPLLESNFRNARRFTGVAWDRMLEGDEWDFFIEEMWQYQWLKEYTELTPELKHCLYNESQGITAIAVQLYMCAQLRAITSQNEKITVKLFEDISKQELKRTSAMIEALRNNDKDALKEYDDIVLDFDVILRENDKRQERMEKAKRLAEMSKKRRENQKEDFIEDAITMLNNMGIFTELQFSDLLRVIEECIEANKGVDYDELKTFIVQQAIKTNNEKKEKKLVKKKKIKKKQGLIGLHEYAIKNNRLVYDVLKDNGYMSSYKEFLG